MFAAACSDDDAISEETQGSVSNGEKSYISVVISNADASSTRGSENSDGGFEAGSGAEQEIVQNDENGVSGARFYFFDKDGKLVVGSEFWDGGETTTPTAENHQIEFEGTTTMVLNIAQGSAMPKYLVTIINPNADTHEYEINTLDNLKEVLTSNYKKANGDFTMTTTSYAHLNADGTVNSAEPYFVTVLDDSYFQSTAEASKANPITVYVERLACKVATTFSITGAKNAGNGLYKITTYDYRDAQGNISSQDVYVKILGWGLNATAKKGYVVKKIDTSWANNIIGISNWNDAANFRSYWAKSYNYAGEDHDVIYQNYFSKFMQEYTSDATSGNDSSKFLRYISANDMNGKGLGTDNPQYCLENTNTAEKLKDYPKSATTNALILAQVVHADGTSFGNIVKYLGKFYDVEYYRQYEFTQVIADDRISRLRDANGNALKLEDVEIVNDSDKYDTYAEKAASTDAEKIHLNGRVVMALTKTAAAKKWYDSTKNNAEVSWSTINNDLAQFNADNEAIGYKNGWMYYSVPIEHFNYLTAAEKAQAEAAGKEAAGTGASDAMIAKYTNQELDKLIEGKLGYYGVVRNHYYKITINDITGLGHGIMDPDEPIVPNDEKEDEYYISAKVNILSWKVVNQTSSL
jgi:hypothetical protein